MSTSAKSRMVYPSVTDLPGWSRTKGRKTVVVVVVIVVIKNFKIKLINTEHPVIAY